MNFIQKLSKKTFSLINIEKFFILSKPLLTSMFPRGRRVTRDEKNQVHSTTSFTTSRCLFPQAPILKFPRFRAMEKIGSYFPLANSTVNELPTKGSEIRDRWYGEVTVEDIVTQRMRQHYFTFRTFLRTLHFISLVHYILAESSQKTSTSKNPIRWF